MTNYTSYILLVALAFASCARPIAHFDYSASSEIIPTKISITNASTKAESYKWFLDDVLISTEEAPDFSIYHSGRHSILLVAEKDGKTSKTSKEVILKAPHLCLVQMETSLGNMTVELFEETPKHRDNFIKLANEGFYSDILFHRVINGFMVQGGDPNSKDPKSQAMGTGGPGYTIDAEFVDSLHHFKGYLAAARQGDNVNPEKKSSGSQFYIVHGKPVDERTLSMLQEKNGNIYSKQAIDKYIEVGGTPFLDTQYTVFGRVINGIEVIDTIANTPTDNRDRPLTDVKILKVTVIQ